MAETQYHYTRLLLDEERLYASVLVGAAIRLGLGRRVVRVAELARRTAWLVGCRDCAVDGRGVDPRAVAASVEQAWRLTGSSRPSFYRAVQVFSRYVVGLGHHVLLRAESASVVRSKARTTVHRPGSALVAVTLDGYVPLASGYGTVRLGVDAEVLVLPAQHSRREEAMTGFLKTRLTLDLERLLNRIRERFGRDPFTTNDIADLIAVTPSSAAQLLARLRDLGYVEKLADTLWRLRETTMTETRNGRQ